MNRPKTKVLMIATFVVALSAGAGAGMVVARHFFLTGVSDSIPGDRSSLAEDLQLSPEQRIEMRRIWEGAQERGKGYYDEIQKLQKGRDDELVGLLNVEQKAKFKKIAEDYADRFSNVVNRREAMFDDAVNATRKILTPAQRERYEKILRNRVGIMAPSPQRDAIAPASWKSGDSSK